MTVEQLIVVLSRFDPNLEVMASWEGTLNDFEEENMEVVPNDPSKDHYQTARSYPILIIDVG